MVVILFCAGDCVVIASIDGTPSTTTIVAARRAGRSVTDGVSRDPVALNGGLEVVDESTKDMVANVFAAIAAGGGAAVTIGPSLLTTGKVTAFVT